MTCIFTDHIGVDDFVGTPPASLRAISRWFIFAQGLLDALIYGLVEWQYVPPLLGVYPS